MTIDLVLINPGTGHAVYGDLGPDLVAVEPPLWVRLIGGYVHDRGYSIAIIDAEAENLTAEDIAVKVVELEPRLVAMVVFGHQPSASTQGMAGARAACLAIKNNNVRLADRIWPIIIVGGHVSALPQRTLCEEPVDFACKGEGPETIVQLLDMLTPETKNHNIARDKIAGLVWWKDTGVRGVRGGWDVIINPPAPLIPMDQLHGDVWDLLPMDRYKSHNWQAFEDLAARKPYASIMTSLGCPYACNFCCINAPFDAHRYRMRTPDDVVNEINNLYENYGVRTFKIVDEMFVLNHRHVDAICDLLIKRAFPESINIWAYARVDTVRAGMLPKMRAAGIRWLALGIESGSKHVRDGADKALRNDDIVGVVREIQAAGINVIGNYIFGLPDDDRESMQATLNLALELNTEFANFYCAMAYPGSKLYDEALAKGWTLPESWAGYSQHNALCRPLDTEHVDAATVLAFRDAAFRAYFTSPAYLEMIGRRFGPETLEHVAAMTTYRLPRRLLGDE